MVYRVEFSLRAVRDLGRIPDEIKWKLVDLLAEIALDAWDPVLSEPTEDPAVRWTTFAGAGFVEFYIWDEIRTVVVRDIGWIG